MAGGGRWKKEGDRSMCILTQAQLELRGAFFISSVQSSSSHCETDGHAGITNYQVRTHIRLDTTRNN